MSEMWKLKQPLFPKKTPSLPSSKLNHRGRLISEPSELVQLLGMEYGKVRLRKRPVHPLHKALKPMRVKLLAMKLSLALKKKTPKLQMEDLDKVLKGLKSNKARDPDGLARIIFNSSIIGSNLKISLLNLFNELKTKCEIPIFMRKATVATIPKKGSKLLLTNEHLIFLVSSV